MSKIIVIGLDGATWDLLKPWADEGELPTVKKLMRNGVWGELESTIPPVTGPAWTSFSTGKNPGKHGVFDFVKIDNNSLRLCQSKDVKAETIHEILSRNKLRSIVIGLPLSFPPSGDFNGIMVSDFLYPGKEITPKSKTGCIEHYRPFPNLLLKGEALLKDMVETAKSQVEAAKQLFVKEDWDFYFFYSHETDSVSHYFWKDIVDNTATGQKAREVFHIADEFLHWILDEMDAEDTLLIMSDHGFADCPFKINLNGIFMQRGLLRTRIKDPSGDVAVAKHVRQEFGKRRGTAVLLWSLRRVATHPRIKPISQRIFKVVFGGPRAKRDVVVDFEKSNAFVPTSESMSVYVGHIEEEKRAEIVEDIVETLRELEYKGRRVFKQVLPKDEVYSGPFVQSAPDILLIPNGFLITQTLGNEVYGQVDGGGFHDLRGIFLAYGSNIRTSSDELTNLKIYDIAPTILHIFGLPIPRQMDGATLKQIFEPSSEPASRRIEYVGTDESERVKRIVRKLNNSKPT